MVTPGWLVTVPTMMLTGTFPARVSAGTRTSTCIAPAATPRTPPAFRNSPRGRWCVRHIERPALIECSRLPFASGVRCEQTRRIGRNLNLERCALDAQVFDNHLHRAVRDTIRHHRRYQRLPGVDHRRGHTIEEHARTGELRR